MNDKFCPENVGGEVERKLYVFNRCEPRHRGTIVSRRLREKRNLVAS